MNPAQLPHQLMQSGQAPPQDPHTLSYHDEMSLYTQGGDYMNEDSLDNRHGMTSAIVSPRRPFFLISQTPESYHNHGRQGMEMIAPPPQEFQRTTFVSYQGTVLII